MVENISDPEKKRLEFDKFIVREYLRYGSVDEIFKRHDYNLPISYPDAHRLVRRWGIIKAAGPNARLSEALEFLTILSQERVPLENLYRRMPPSFQTSMSTLHRILSHIRHETIRRVGTALVIAPEGNPNLVLVGNDVSTPRPELGKEYGSISFPMGYSSRVETIRDSILRVLQQEVFTEMAVEKRLPLKIIPDLPQPFMYLDIADVRVAVYHLALPKSLVKLENFSSYKIVDHRYLHIGQLADGKVEGYKLRTGLQEIALGYEDYRKNVAAKSAAQPIFAKSFLNLELVLLPLQLEKF
jgi:hypothetical protein